MREFVRFDVRVLVRSGSPRILPLFSRSIRKALPGFKPDFFAEPLATAPKNFRCLSLTIFIVSPYANTGSGIPIGAGAGSDLARCLYWP